MGASLVRAGAIGLLARLIVPVGALVHTYLLQPGLGSSSRPAETWARVILLAAAGACIGLVLIRFALGRRRAPA